MKSGMSPSSGTNQIPSVEIQAGISPVSDEASCKTCKHLLDNTFRLEIVLPILGGMYICVCTACKDALCCVSSSALMVLNSKVWLGKGI